MRTEELLVEALCVAVRYLVETALLVHVNADCALLALSLASPDRAQRPALCRDVSSTALLAAAAAAIGCSCGAAALTWLVQCGAMTWARQWLTLSLPPAAPNLLRWLSINSPPLLTLSMAVPSRIPTQPLLLAAGLAGTQWTRVVAAALIGAACRGYALAWAVSERPRWLRKLGLGHALTQARCQANSAPSSIPQL